MSASVRVDIGGLARRRDQVTAGFLRASAKTVRKVTFDTRDELRGVITGAGLGRLGRAVGARVYDRFPLKPLGAVYPRDERGALTLQAYAFGAKIRPKNGKYLAIPLPAAGRLARGRRITPRLWEEKNGQKLGFVRLPNGNAVLMARRALLDKRGRAKIVQAGKRSALRAGNVAVFVLVREASVSRRFSLQAIRASAQRNLEATFLRLTQDVVVTKGGAGGRR